MFVHISPKPDAVGETISTLKFAERVATVELGAACVNKDSSDVKELKEEVRILIFAFNAGGFRGRERAAKRERGREKALEQRHCGRRQQPIWDSGNGKRKI
ncbi:P-loop nucleoside triphosphate hydrolase superfamily protein with CH (Calponin-like proteiny) domain [Abeliophyllum distichum]|uniref:P-loop nucleoside triphosphate hydrolase superfamily protein with CH (Calponin-like proteiny) domain n=1 Tax=Abeliophyllum distichum TaxID=126358 RepID=A0ABD1UNV5_9LAMI